LWELETESVSLGFTRVEERAGSLEVIFGGGSRGEVDCGGVPAGVLKNPKQRRKLTGAANGTKAGEVVVAVDGGDDDAYLLGVDEFGIHEDPGDPAVAVGEWMDLGKKERCRRPDSRGRSRLRWDDRDL
jgi:hypothetical protein